MTTTARDTVRYVSGAYALLRAMRENWSDDDLIANQGARFFYFVDTNVAIWYGNPGELIDRVALFLPKASQGVRALDFLTSALTVEYIFSRNLPGCDGNPCFLTPNHADELVDKLVELRTTISTAATVGDRLGKQDPSFDPFRKALQGYQQSPSEARLDHLYGIFARLVSNVEAGAGFMAASLGRLVAEERVARAEAFHLLDNDRVAPSDELVSTWKLRISTYKKAIDVGKTENLEHDARSLAQIQLLNEAAAADNLANYFVLISGDRALHSAVEVWCLECKARGVAMRSFMRHPRQFIPILNFLNYDPLRSGQGDWFWKLRNSVEDLIAAYSDFGGVSPSASEHFTEEIGPMIEAKLRNGAPRLVQEKALELRDNWTTAIRTASLINAAPLLQRADTTLSQAVELVTAEAVSRSLEGNLDSGLKGIARAHISFAVRGRIAAIIGAAKVKGTKFTTRTASRGPLLFWFVLGKEELAPFGLTPSGVNSVNVLLEWLFDNATIDQVAQVESLIMAIPAAASAYAAAAAVSYRAGAWIAARHFSERGLNLLTKNEVGGQLDRELRYCYWVACRFLVNDFFKFQVLRREIFVKGALYRRSGDHFRFARANSELGSLMVFFVTRTLSGARPVTGPSEEYLHSVLIEALRCLNHADAYCDNYGERGGTADDERIIWRRLSFQINHNKCAIHVLRLLGFGDVLSPHEVEQVRDDLSALRKLDQELGRWKIGLAELLIAVLDWSFERDLARKAVLKGLAVNKLREAPKTLGALHIVDVEFIKWICSILEKTQLNNG